MAPIAGDGDGDAFGFVDVVCLGAVPAELLDEFSRDAFVDVEDLWPAVSISEDCGVVVVVVVVTVVAAW